MTNKVGPFGTVNTPWKRAPSGVFVPGNMGVSTGRNITGLQDLIRQVYLAANQKTLTIICSAEMVELTAGVVSRQYNLCTNRLDYTQATAGSRMTFTASDPGLGGKPCISANGARSLVNLTDPAAPGTTPWYQKSVSRLDSWPPGAKCIYGATANRFGAFTLGTPDQVQLSNSSGTVEGPVDMPLSRWGVLTFRMGNSTADQIRFGATLNGATGINVGNTNPLSIGKAAIASGTMGSVSSEAIQFVWTQDLTLAEDHAVEDLLQTYFGGGLLIYSSTGNIRSAGIGWLGSSQTRFSLGAAVNFQGARFTFYTQFWTTNNYPIWTTGHTADGNWPQPAHDGESGLGINIDITSPNPGVGLARANNYLNPAGASPNNGAGKYAYINLELGGADIAGGVYVPVTTANDLLTIAQALATNNPRAVIGINTICPQLGDPPTVAQFSSEIRDPGGIWDQFDTWAAAHSHPNCARPDLNLCINGGVYTAALFLDNVHLNQTGQQQWGAEIDTKCATAMNLVTQY